MNNKDQNELPKHELIRLLGNVTIQLGLTMIGISTIMKQIGNLPDQPIYPPNLGGRFDYENKNAKNGYFD
jgi:hypothetical protein